MVDKFAFNINPKDDFKKESIIPTIDEIIDTLYDP
jgi:hypothetical protein